jgi:hypothetical protein
MGRASKAKINSSYQIAYKEECWSSNYHKNKMLQETLYKILYLLKYQTTG